MSESDGMDDVLDGGLRQSLMIASRIAETLARRRLESQRQIEHQDVQAAHEARARLAAERSTARAALAPVDKDQWWDNARPHDIATAHAVAEGWKDHDPAALTASEKIRQEVLTRYGIDTRDVGTDAAYLASGIETIAAEQARRAAVAEHRKAMALIAAAQAEELRTKARTLASEMERHQVPVEYLSNPALSAALHSAQDATTPAAIEAADTAVKERLYLIGKDGINGPTIEQLREETTANFNGAGDRHFKDATFVDAAKEWHEAKLLAEGGFKGSQEQPLEQRYERTEAELFARIEAMGRELETRVTGDDNSKRLQDQGRKAETSSGAEYGSADHHQAFAASLFGTASEERIKGRLAAARSEGTHPSAALVTGKAPAKPQKTSRGAAMGAPKSRSGPSR
ncbi:hypothetical protein SAMN04487914_14217 [Arthrobacter sp. ok909]|uniref:hypothetical protein n=1 Tax=Arthrobacter sp. ok909 TaxID=1761746 RepID=UPI00088AE5C7|nr:hypothetical protein [Arthrobacter sp. ok909]SDP80183.1 hypothetical protein SAMN04487914_14217 [Arthrobacter sp. ok909]